MTFLVVAVLALITAGVAFAFWPRGENSRPSDQIGGSRHDGTFYVEASSDCGD